VACIAPERMTVLVGLTLFATACGGADAPGATPTGGGSVPSGPTATETDGDAAHEPGSARDGDPFVWEDGEVAEHLGLGEPGDLLAARFEVPDGTTCELAIRNSAMEVHLSRQSGRRVVTNATATVGVEVVGPPLDPPQLSEFGGTEDEVDPACYAALPEDLDDLEPGPRDDAARRADVDALDAELLRAAEHNVPGTVDEGWWPGLDVSVLGDTATLSGYSLGRCRTVTVAVDGTVTGPSDC
jgi:hypothetical protein